MYAYTYDPETGGILLNDSTPLFSKEPRPVYAREMDILGFDQHWQYEKQDDSPYMWAESNCYWYRGIQVAKTRGGSLYVKPEVEYLTNAEGKEAVPAGTTLLPVDIEAMCEKNRALLEVLEQTTTKKIFNVYKRYRKRLDCFHVAFSGGKDSIVLLELVKKALPESSFVVVFGDTGMEFPDTYDVIDRVEEQCRQEKIEFYRASSHLSPEESWRLFGPPSRVLRWCCSVHKSTPQVIKLREILGKPDYQGMAFVGVRAHESISRSEYEYESFSTKQKGQYSYNAILEWTSVEIWLYIYKYNLLISEAYKYGNARVGCIFCPMSLKTDYLKSQIYTSSLLPFVEIVQENYTPENIANGYWCARQDGTALKGTKEKCIEYIDNDEYVIEVNMPNTNWRNWFVTLGELPFNYTIQDTQEGYIIRFKSRYLKEFPKETGLFKKIFHKAAYCVGCRVCEINCRHGCISFQGNQVQIEGCIHCQECNQLDGGCLAYKSLRIPYGKGVSNMKKESSINIFSTHAPKTEWLENFFIKEEAFLTDNNLGSEQVKRFFKFLQDSGLIDKKKFTPFASKLKSLKWDSEIALGLFLVNLAYHIQIKWYIQNFDLNVEYSRKEAEEKIISTGISETSKSVGQIVCAFGRLCDLPLGTVLHFGNVVKKGSQIQSLTRTKTVIPDSRVVLYALYRFAEACEGYFSFTLSRLLDFSVESEGVSPAQIFGLERDQLEPILNGLSVNYPDFISVSFTHDLEKIVLNQEKKSKDVLELF